MPCGLVCCPFDLRQTVRWGRGATSGKVAPLPLCVARSVCASRRVIGRQVDDVRSLPTLVVLGRALNGSLVPTQLTLARGAQTRRPVELMVTKVTLVEGGGRY